MPIAFPPFLMSCGSCSPSSPKGIAGLLLRYSFCVSLIFVGLAHYMTIDTFAVMVSDGLGPLAPLGNLWAYIMPGLFIVGGLLLLVGKYVDIGAWAAGIGLGSIPAGMLLKPLMSGMGLSEMMPGAINAFIWLLVFVWVAKFAGCGSCCINGKCMDCGKMECKCK